MESAIDKSPDVSLTQTKVFVVYAKKAILKMEESAYILMIWSLQREITAKKPINMAVLNAKVAFTYSLVEIVKPLKQDVLNTEEKNALHAITDSIWEKENALLKVAKLTIAIETDVHNASLLIKLMMDLAIFQTVLSLIQENAEFAKETID